MFNSIEQLLLNSETQGKDYNFQSIEPKRKYLVKNIDLFWDLIEKVNGDSDIGILERPQNDYSVLRFDIDIVNVNNVDKEKRLYNDNDINLTIKFIFKLISELNREIPKEKYICYCLEKENYSKHDGFHLFFPYIIVYNTYQNSFFVEKLQDYLNNIGKSFKVDNVATLSWVINFKTLNKKNERYKVTKVFDKELNLLDNNIKLRELSINSDVNKDCIYGYKIEYKTKELQNEITSSLEYIIETKILYKLKNRSNNYNDWIDIGMILFNEGNSSLEALNLWKEFSKNSDKYDEEECNRKWNSFQKKNKTMKSLFYYLKIDDPLEFNELMNSEFISSIKKKIIDESETDREIDITDFSIAQMVYKKYFLDIVACDIKKDNYVWYKFEYNLHKWILITKSDMINIIFELGKKEILPLCDIYIGESINEKDLHKYYKDVKKKFKLKIGSYKCLNSCVNACACLFQDKNFLSIKDTNVNLIGCENGVFDMSTNIFRNGIPSDYITLSTKIIYRDNYKNTEEERLLNNFFLELLDDKNIIENFLELLALSIKGKNEDKIFAVCKGETDSGKSTLAQLIEKTLGDYAFNLPNSLLYKKKSSNSSEATPALSHTKCKRFGSFKEADGDRKIDSSIIKALTGNDKLYSRSLYSEAEDLTTMFVLYLFTNYIPEGPIEDTAYWNRMHIIEFSSKFVENKNAPKTLEEQQKNRIYPKDKKLNNNFDKLAPCLLSKFFDIIMSKKEYIAHPQFKENVKEYLENRDIIFLYVNEKIKIKSENDTKTKLVYEDFKSWYPSFNSVKDLPNHLKFEERVSQILNKKIIRKKGGKVWEGIILCDNDENEI